MDNEKTAQAVVAKCDKEKWKAAEDASSVVRAAMAAAQAGQEAARRALEELQAAGQAAMIAEAAAAQAREQLGRATAAALQAQAVAWQARLAVDTITQECVARIVPATKRQQEAIQQLDSVRVERAELERELQAVAQELQAAVAQAGQQEQEGDAGEGVDFALPDSAQAVVRELESLFAELDGVDGVDGVPDVPM